MDTFEEKPLNKKEEVELIESGISRERLEEELIRRNHKLVLKTAHKYKHVCDFNDLVQEGSKGLAIAAQRFDINRKPYVKFSSFAIFYIRKYILGWIGSEIKENNISDDGKTPVISINRPAIDDESGEIQEILNVETAYVSPSAKIEKANLNDILELCIQNLTTEEQKVIRRRIFTDEKSTFSVLSKEMGYSISNIKAIEVKALKKLQLDLSKYGITSLMDMF